MQAGELEAPFAVGAGRTGCGGVEGDWYPAHDIADPRDVSFRSSGVENETCLVSRRLGPHHGISALLSAREGPAGFALRYIDENRYTGIYLDIAAGLVTARAWNHERSTLLGSSTFPAPREPVRVTAAAAGGRLVVLVEGRRVLSAEGVEPLGERTALLAGPLAKGEFFRPAVFGLKGQVNAFIDAAAPPAAKVGAEYAMDLPCASLQAASGRPVPCRLEIASGSLPPGIRLTDHGRLVGRPEAAGVFVFGLRGGRPGGPPRRSFSLRVDGVSWPRFPHDPRTGAERELALLYTPDDIGQTVTWEGLGRPDRRLFLLHRDHPELKITLTLCPANRYAAPVVWRDRPESVSVWREIASGLLHPWLELGGHGLTHSPDGDNDLHHHEFSVTQTGCNVDHSRLGDRAYCLRRFAAIRREARAAGLPDRVLTVFRFPGVQDSPEALRAAARHGVRGILGSRHLDEPGREWWVPLPGGGELLEIQSVPMLRAFALSAELEAKLASGDLRPSDVSGSREFLAAVSRGRAVIDSIEGNGGIVNLFNHWWETFQEIGGAMPRYSVLDAVLKDVFERRLGRVWYPRSSELALWLETRRRASIQWEQSRGAVMVRIAPPRERVQDGVRLPEASVLLHLPAGFGRVRDVRLAGQPLSAERWRSVKDGLVATFPLDGPTILEALAAGPGGS
ncbi:MAG TPA: hypothetical protein VJV23_16655 [Candidatus Polarisedimenticolia bacterium]|nr:hypothetical protein [Candidatus Polarisedimenticolia bacterium]